MSMSFAALKVAHYLASNAGRDQFVPEEICARGDLASVHAEFVGNGMIYDDHRLGGSPSFAILSAAQTQLRALARQYRQAAIQLEILSQVDARPDSRSIEDYFPPTGVLGEPVEEKEYNRAVSHLLDWGLIKGDPTGQGILIRPELTTVGYQALESGLSPQIWFENRRGVGAVTQNFGDTNSQTNNFSGPVGSYQQGNHNTSTVTQTIGFDSEAFGAILGQIREMIHAAGLDEDTLDVAAAQLDVIENKANSGVSEGRIKKFFEALFTTLPTALATEVADLAGQAISALPA